jgi:hypothetical protein
VTHDKDQYADLKQHRLTPETLAKLAAVPQKIQKRRQQFVMVPWRWIDRLATTSSANTYRVALHLLHQHWKNNSRPFLLPNGLLVMEGVTRHSKWRALTKLERLGLISVEKRPDRSPRVTVHA